MTLGYVVGEELRSKMDRVVAKSIVASIYRSVLRALNLQSKMDRLAVNWCVTSIYKITLWRIAASGIEMCLSGKSGPDDLLVGDVIRRAFDAPPQPEYTITSVVASTSSSRGYFVKRKLFIVKEACGNTLRIADHEAKAQRFLLTQGSVCINGNGRQLTLQGDRVSPSLWGISKAQIRTFYKRCPEDDKWEDKMSVRSMVDKILAPMNQREHISVAIR